MPRTTRGKRKAGGAREIMFPSLNDRERDQIFLKLCFEEDRAALIQWNVDSYRTEVIRTIKAVIDRKVPGRLRSRLITSLVEDCTWIIYENYGTLPSSLHVLKIQVRKFTLAYVNKYLADFLRTNPWR
jgi:hypothetical protein